MAQDASIELKVRVTTRASSPRIEPDGVGGCRVWVTSPPAEGEANKAVVELVAKAMGVAKSGVTIVRGMKSRDKVLALTGLSAQDVAALLDRLAGGGA